MDIWLGPISEETVIMMDTDRLGIERQITGLEDMIHMWVTFLTRALVWVPYIAVALYV